MLEIILSFILSFFFDSKTVVEKEVIAIVEPVVSKAEKAARRAHLRQVMKPKYKMTYAEWKENNRRLDEIRKAS